VPRMTPATEQVGANAMTTPSMPQTVASSTGTKRPLENAADGSSEAKRQKE